MKKEIVKVQVPLNSNIDNPPALVYNKDQSIFQQAQLTKELSKAMGDQPKKYFYCEFKDGQLELLEEAKWQEW